ncbi:MAG: aromatic amino acid transport family protein [bacterium]|nr:aromatic amino acid transport family protein [bacterium]
MGVFLRHYVLPVSLLSGTIIGAGVFSLPFVFTAGGWLTALGYLAAFGGVFVLIHLMYADVMFSTDNAAHDFVGYARRYLGAWAGRIAFLMTVVGMILALTIYLVLSASFSAILLPNQPQGALVLFFWALGSLLMFLPVRGMAALEALAVLVIVGIVGIVAAKGLPHIDRLASVRPLDLRYLFLPFGPVLFSYAGRVAIPSLLSYLKGEGLPPLHARKIIMWGTVLPGVVYLLFAAGVIGLSNVVSEDAVSGIVGLSPTLLGTVGVLVLASLLSSYFVVGVSVIRILEKDLRLSRLASGTLVIASPVLLYAAGLQNFLVLVGISGGVFIALEGVFIALMWRKAHEKQVPLLLSPRWKKAVWALTLVFIAGAFYEIIRVL